MPRVYGEAPYRDYYDPRKGYVQQLAIPGRGAQAVEFTQMGTLMLDLMKRYGDAIFKDGNIIQGCQLRIEGTTAKITEGKIYMDGIIHYVLPQEVDIKGVGREQIGVILEETIVTEVEDADFYDPAVGYENYGQPGTHRVKNTIKFVANNPEAVTVFELDEGKLYTITTEETPQLDVITEILARRTYDESGNYKVDGLKMVEKGTETQEYIDVSLSEGKAYVLGYEVIKPTATTFKIKKALTTRSVISEPKNYQRGVTEYTLNNHPVKEVTKFVVTTEITDTITRGSVIGGIDYLPHNPVVTILEVKQSDKTFTRGVDFQLVNDGLDWSLLGEEPSVGTQYTVKYRYKNILTSGSDFDLIVDGTTSKVKFKTSYLPVDNTEMAIDYDFYLARKDTVCINSLGQIVVREGKPDIIRNVEPVVVKDNDLLILGTVTAKPNSKEIIVSNNSVTRVDFKALQKVIKRVDDMEINQAVTDLDKEAMSGEPATQLKGVFTDGFQGTSKADINHSNFNAAFDLSRGEITLPSVSMISELNPDDTSFETNVGYLGNVITAPFEEVLALEQLKATQAMLINPYAVFDKVLPVKLNPSVDNWVDEKVVVVEETKTTSSTLRRWWYHQGEPWADEEKKKWEDLGFVDGGQSLEWDTGRTSNSNTSSEIVLDEAIQFMRQTEVEVKAYSFPFNQDNIKATFDDIEVDLTPIAPTKRGTTPGSVMADANGDVHCRFTVPEGVPCGSKEFKIYTPTINGTATYTANGRFRIRKDTILKEEVVVKPVDPLAQTFQFDKDYSLTSAELFFAEKEDGVPVCIQIRNVVNGYPGNIAYAEEVISSKDIKVSDNGTEGTIVNFSNPVMCKKDTQYCIVVMTDSNTTKLYVSKLGERDLATGEYVTSNSYVAGVLFSSSNAITWSPHQDMDMKFRLFRAKFRGKGVVLFDRITVPEADRLLLAIEQLSPTETGVDWYYSINRGSWEPAVLYSDRDTSIIAKDIDLKAEITATDSRSPMISGDNLNLVTFLNQAEGRYVSKNVTFADGFNKVKVMLQVAAPTGTSYEVYIATDTAGVDWTKLNTPKTSPVDEEFVQLEYETDVSTSKNYRVMIKLNTTNPLARPRARKLMSILKDI